MNANSNFLFNKKVKSRAKEKIHSLYSKDRRSWHLNAHSRHVHLLLFTSDVRSPTALNTDQPSAISRAFLTALIPEFNLKHFVALQA